MIQKTLFDPPTKLSRKSDKLTSQKSAAETEKKLTGLQEKMMHVSRCMGEVKAPTANEAAAMCIEVFRSGLSETYRKRAKEMVRAGFIEEAGERPCKVTGKTATTYTARQAQP